MQIPVSGNAPESDTPVEESSQLTPLGFSSKHRDLAEGEKLARLVSFASNHYFADEPTMVRIFEGIRGLEVRVGEGSTYRIEKLLGFGDRGKVVLARDAELSAQDPAALVALKISRTFPLHCLSLPPPDDPRMLEPEFIRIGQDLERNYQAIDSRQVAEARQWLREIHALKRLTALAEESKREAPRAVFPTLRDARVLRSPFDSQSRFFMVAMDYLPGPTFYQFLGGGRDRAIDSLQLVQFLRGVVQGTTYLMERGIYLADWNQGNYLLARRPGSEATLAGIIDFGRSVLPDRAAEQDQRGFAVDFRGYLSSPDSLRDSSVLALASLLKGCANQLERHDFILPPAVEVCKALGEKIERDRGHLPSFAELGKRLEEAEGALCSDRPEERLSRLLRNIVNTSWSMPLPSAAENLHQATPLWGDNL